MISGVVNDALEAILSLQVRVPNGEWLQVEAIVDTGFSAFLTLPSATIESLGLPWLCRQQGMLADGRLHLFDVYAANLAWDDSERTIEVDAADADPLLGMALLNGHQLHVDVQPHGKVTIVKLI